MMTLHPEKEHFFRLIAAYPSVQDYIDAFALIEQCTSENNFNIGLLTLNPRTHTIECQTSIPCLAGPLFHLVKLPSATDDLLGVYEYELEKIAQEKDAPSASSGQA